MKNNKNDARVIELEALHGLNGESILKKMAQKRQADIEYTAKALTKLQSTLQGFASEKLKSLNVDGKKIKPTKSALFEFAAFMLQEIMKGAHIEVNHSCKCEDGTWSCIVPEIKYDGYTIQSSIFDEKILTSNESE